MEAECPIKKKSVPIIESEIKISHFGSGIEAVCPGHYLSDYALSLKCDIPKTSYVDRDSKLSRNLDPTIAGKDVISEEANLAVI